MSNETKFTAFVLKKQPFSDSDEIITFYSKEAGKIRGLAKSIKSAKSKLQQKLQSLFLVDLRMAGSKLPKIIFAEPLKVFAGLRENLDAMKMAFYAVELSLKFTPDEEVNLGLFDLLDHFFSFLDKHANPKILDTGLAKFKIEFLQHVGVGLQYISDNTDQQIYFSHQRGGFTLDRSVDGITIESLVLKDFIFLKQSDFHNLPQISSISTLQELLSHFITYQLERQVKSEKYLSSEV